MALQFCLGPLLMLIHLSVSGRWCRELSWQKIIIFFFVPVCSYSPSMDTSLVLSLIFAAALLSDGFSLSFPSPSQFQTRWAFYIILCFIYPPASKAHLLPEDRTCHIPTKGYGGSLKLYSEIGVLLHPFISTWHDGAASLFAAVMRDPGVGTSDFRALLAKLSPAGRRSHRTRLR